MVFGANAKLQQQRQQQQNAGICQLAFEKYIDNCIGFYPKWTCFNVMDFNAMQSIGMENYIGSVRPLTTVLNENKFN